MAPNPDAQIKAGISQLCLELDNCFGKFVGFERLINLGFVLVLVLVFIRVVVVAPWWPRPWRPDLRIGSINECRRNTQSSLLRFFFGLICKDDKKSFHDLRVYKQNCFLLVVFLWCFQNLNRHREVEIDLRWQTKAGLTEPQNHVVRIYTYITFNVETEQCANAYNT